MSVDQPRAPTSIVVAMLRPFLVLLLFWLPSLALLVWFGNLAKTYSEFAMKLPWLTTLVLDSRLLLIPLVIIIVVTHAVVLYSLNLNGSQRRTKILWSAFVMAGGVGLFALLALAALLPMIQLLEGLNR